MGGKMTNNSMETVFEIEVTPEQLFEIANKLEAGAKVAHMGQVIRVKMNSQFHFVYRPIYNIKNENVFIEKDLS